MNLLLIAGHGAGDPGATSNGYQEAVETRRVVQALAGVLKDYCNVSQYPTGRNAYSDYKNGQLLATAKFSQYHYVLEVHFNAYMATRTDGVTMGVECYVPTAEGNTTTETALCSNLAKLGLKNRGVKKKDYSVIWSARKQGTRAALLEVCFIDDQDDMWLYESRFDQVIQAIAKSIMDGFGLQWLEQEQEEAMTGKEIYEKLNEYTATLPVPEWAEKELAEAKAAGITDGTNPMQLIPRYQAALMAHRAVQAAVGQKKG